MSDAAATPARRDGGAPPFGQYERMLAVRYLFATRKDGGVALMSVIAFVGVMLAVAALIAVMSIMNGFRNEMVTRLIGVDGHIYVASPYALQQSDAETVAAELRSMAGVAAAFPIVAAPAGVTGASGQLAYALVRGMTAEDIAASGFIQDSRVFGGDVGFGAGDGGGDTIYVGRALGGLLGAGLGDMVELIGPEGANTIMGRTTRRKAYEIGDFVETGLRDYDQVLLYMPLEQAQIFFNRRQFTEDGTELRFVDRVEVRIDDPNAVEQMRQRIQRQLGAAYMVTDWRDQNAALFNALQVERGAMRLILMLVVVIAALNIISGFTMLVRDKARDIAILRTVGVEKGSVMRVFLMSGFMLGGVGTLAGLGLGVLFCIYIGPIQHAVEAVCRCEVFAADVYGLDHLPALLDWSEVMVVSLWGFFVSVLVTLIPAWFAARLDPVEALRYE